MNAQHNAESPATEHRHPRTRDDLHTAMVDLVNTARYDFAIVTPALDAAVWNRAAMGEAVGHFVARHAGNRARIVVEDTDQLLTGCVRLVELARRFSDLILIRRLGEPHRGLREMFAVADRGHCLAQPDVSRVDATLDLAAPGVAAPFLQRFEEIWTAAEIAPGIHGFRL
jgi:hypothetical protein